MSLHWTLIAGFLYAEIIFLLLLLVPFISPKRWKSVFKSKFFMGLGSQLIYYFYVLVAILILFFLDAIREMRKYSDEQSAIEHDHTRSAHLDTQMQMHMRLFRAQRNFYISGFALFLCLVINRMVQILSENATLEAQYTAAMKQAQSASAVAESIVQSDKERADGDNKLKEELEKSKNELKTARADLEAMKSQSESLTKEYDRLLAEKDKMERRLRILDNEEEGVKKDD